MWLDLHVAYSVTICEGSFINILILNIAPQKYKSLPNQCNFPVLFVYDFVKFKIIWPIFTKWVE